MVPENEHPSFGNRLWPALDRPFVALEIAREFTDTELGVDHVACPAEIREMVRWP